MVINCEIQRTINRIDKANKHYALTQTPDNAAIICIEVRHARGTFEDVCDWSGSVDKSAQRKLLRSIDQSCELLRRSMDMVLRFVTQMRRESIADYKPWNPKDTDATKKFSLSV